MGVGGAIRKLLIDSGNYTVTTDSDFTVKPAAETSTTPTTGSSIVMVEKKVQDVEGIKVDATDSAIYDALEGIALGGVPVPVSFQTANLQVWQSEACLIGLGDKNSREGTLDITLHPLDGWTKS